MSNLRVVPPSLLASTPAARLEQLMELYRPSICDDDGNVIGYVNDGEGYITREQLLKLLDEVL